MDRMVLKRYEGKVEKNPKPILQSGSNYLSPSLELKSNLVQAKLCTLEQNPQESCGCSPQRHLGVPGSFSILCLLLMEFLKAESLRLTSVPRVRIPLLHSIC